ncbi:hypothetical protein D3C76_1649010 [compost metagenome]
MPGVKWRCRDGKLLRWSGLEDVVDQLPRCRVNLNGRVVCLQRRQLPCKGFSLFLGIPGKLADGLLRVGDGVSRCM